MKIWELPEITKNDHYNYVSGWEVSDQEEWGSSCASGVVSKAFVFRAFRISVGQRPIALGFPTLFGSRNHELQVLPRFFQRHRRLSVLLAFQEQLIQERDRTGFVHRRKIYVARGQEAFKQIGRVAE